MAEGSIEHVVVLMLENRSFDHLLGFLDHPSPDFPVLRAGEHPNRLNPSDPTSPTTGVSADAGLTLALDPPHSHKSVIEQLHVGWGRGPQMDGFVAAYARKAAGKEERPVVHWWRLAALAHVAAALVSACLARLVGAGRRVWLVVYLVIGGALSLALSRAKRSLDDPKVADVDAEVMQCMAPERIPVLATLAKEFAVCTRWHCSVPGETWPNRNFLHAATSEETVAIEIGFYESPTIFDTLEREGSSWRVYHDGRAQLWAFRHLWLGERIGRWGPVSDFEEHVANGDLATYSFIEPDHHGRDSGSQHPNNNKPASNGADFLRGEQLIADIYGVLRRHPQVFEKTLLLVTYDEHGGLFDHVPPPTDVAAPEPMPKGRLSRTRRLVSFFIERGTVRFRFRMLGPRVPTVVVSPLVPRHTVDDQLYDHSSVVATVRRLFAPAAPALTARDREANTFGHLASLSEPRPVEDLPDLHAQPVPEPQQLAAVDSTEDEFSRQLGELGGLVTRELDVLGAPEAPPSLAADGGDDVVRRFHAAAALSTTLARSNPP